MTKVLLVEDNAGLREQMKWALCNEFDVREADSSLSCRDMFHREQPRLVCLDMGLDNVPDKGMDLIDDMLSIDRSVKIVVITAHTSETFGPRALAKGAFDYLRKPVDIDELTVILRRAARLCLLQDKGEQDKKKLSDGGLESGPDMFMIGASEKMRRLFETIRKLAATNVNVLITGESGTGKEVCARAIHFHSDRNAYPFVPINCGAIPETLLESELFGYVRGAFTDARNDKTGLIESADNGTLFLDEIGDMPRHLQVKLLRFLEDQQYQRLGDVSFRQASVRIVAATNHHDLSSPTSDVLRSDLYYRLSEFEIHLPPLRDRGEDVLLLARAFVKRNRSKFNLPLLELSSRAQQAVLGYSWPGNIRELENKLNRAAITCTNQVIEVEDLNLASSSLSNLSLKAARDMFEREFIFNALEQTGFTISETARLLEISRPTLYDLMKKHNIAGKSSQPR